MTTPALPPPGVADLHVEEHPGRPLATVWLHHGVGSCRAWDAFLPGAAEGRCALAYDRRGFGASPHRRRFTAAMFDEDAAELAGLLEARAAVPAHLVGHSDGGSVALAVAAQRPELVASVVAVAAHLFADAGTVATLRAMGPPREWPGPLQRNLARVHGADWEDVCGAWQRLWTSPELAAWSLEPQLGRIRCPVLAIHDRADPLAPALHATRLVAAVPGATLSWRDTRTHDPHRGDRDRFAAECVAHWAAAEGSAR